jgi:two-component system sensor histidine kinase VanS
MKSSIRFKLFIAVTGLIVFFVLFSALLNTKYLDKYYTSQKTRFLVNTARDIDNNYHGSPEDIYFKLESLERNAGINVLIIDKFYNLKYSSFPRFERFGMRKSDPHRVIILNRASELKDRESIVEITGDPRLGSNFLNLLFLLNNSDYLLLSTPIAAIEENAAAANTFFLYTGLLTVIIGSILAFLFSRQFTQPILKLNSIAQRMAKLDFSQKYDGQNTDEIGKLGNSINILSQELYKSISELQDVNAKLQQDIERERKIDEMRKEFISNVSHELKTPIALIQGYAEGLKVGVVKNEGDKNFYCDVIIDETSKMNKLVKDLLVLSQIESGCFSLEKSTFNISYLIRQIIAKFEPILSNRNIKVQFSENSSEVQVYADMVRSEQVLVNYLNNAINHLDERQILKIDLNQIGNKIRLSVFNSGKNIPEESLQKVFTSFYKVDKARTRAYGGTGLGLSVVRAIQELDNNDFGVRNLEGGVEFWFELDLAWSGNNNDTISTL